MAGGSKRGADDVLVAALATGQTVADAARAAGVSAATVYRRKADPAFAARVGQVRSDMLGEALGRLAGNLLLSVDKLAGLIDNPDPRVALSACRAILESTITFRVNVDLAARLAELEAVMREAQARRGA